ncbi:gfo/Idh/MocA family oxidoreductase, partial [Verrucomicrobia bacterium]|nr:gfo/Idh/MocA family oxidoreductase [Verrucomicrobiota bacterium]
RARDSELDKAEEMFLKDKKVGLYESSNHVVDFIECMRSRKKPNTHEGIGARSSICCHLMNQSYYNRQAILWDPIKLKFKKGSGHPSWMTRDYRGSWVVA